MNDNQKEIKFIDLFAGVGGFHKGLTQSNNSFRRNTKECSKNEKPFSSTNRSNGKRRRTNSFNCVWANEWDKHAATIYQKNFPKTPFHKGDIRLVKTNNIPEADLLVAGFPCQPFSLAGKRKGFEETRGTLFYEILRIARDKRIKFLLLENVKGLLSAQEGKAFGTILSSLDELGYCLQWQVLNSKNFGVPQNRERVFIIGCLGKKRFKQIFPLGQNVQETNGNGPVVRTLTGGGHSGGLHSQSTGIISKTTRTGGRGSLTKKHAWDLVINPTKNCGLKQVGIIGKVDTQSHRVYSTDGNASCLSGEFGGVGAKTGLYAVLTPDRENKRQNGPRFKKEGEPMFTLTGQDVHGIAIGSFGRKEGFKNKQISPTISSTYYKGIQHNQGEPAIQQNQRIRRLTPTECERLQGFPDGWTEGLSDTQRYKCMGNAVTTNVITAIGNKMLEVDLFD